MAFPALIPAHQEPKRVTHLKKYYAPEYASSQTDLSIIRSHPGDRLTNTQLFYYRSSALAVCTCILIAGVVMQFTVKIDYLLVDLCILRNTSFVTNSSVVTISSLPYCN